MTTISNKLAGDFDTAGFVILPQVLNMEACAVAAGRVGLAARGAGGTRCLLAQPWCADIAASLRAALGACIPADSVAVQCTYFEKSSDRNWLVPIHQDLSIPVAARVGDSSLRGWSEKEGVLFVRAPVAVLERLVAVRIHLDVCGMEDGPLRVVPGSHLRGAIADSDAVASRQAGLEVACLAGIGDALVLRPLLLHASSKGSGSGMRRVLHFVFGPPHLPFGLAWHTAL
ncbi:MAG: phytanoyl-CoA dioxygenase family protein [Pseudomonadota bacterium]